MQGLSKIHTVLDVEYHLAIVIKCGHPVLTKEVNIFLSRYTYRLFETNFDCEVLKVNMDKDHIHILFSTKPKVQLNKMVNSYKL